jgi:4-hydroxybenzoate polyprenyltransferase
MRLKPERGYLKRMRTYLREMYPPIPRLASACLVTAGFMVLMARIHGLRPALLSPWALLGAWNVFALLLILRLMDELKDREIDRALFRERPLPSGRVTEPDIAWSLVAMCVLFLAPNAASRPTLLAAAGVLAYAFLMFGYFFAPAYFRAHLLPNLATHNPIVALMQLELVAVFSAGAGLVWRDIRWPSVLGAVAMNWAMFFAWEVSRKVRSPEQEDAYVTYSRIFGPAGAAAVAGAAQTATLVLALLFFSSLGFSPAAYVPLGAGYLLALTSLLRFVHRPGPSTSKLRPFAEAYILFVLAAVTLGGLLARPR